MSTANIRDAVERLNLPKMVESDRSVQLTLTESLRLIYWDHPTVSIMVMSNGIAESILC